MRWKGTRVSMKWRSVLCLNLAPVRVQRWNAVPLDALPRNGRGRASLRPRALDAIDPDVAIPLSSFCVSGSRAAERRAWPLVLGRESLVPLSPISLR